ncbi:MAG: alcohol dehydrogenase catalytic domain-containing protein [Acidimicrobiales bacterium]
MFGWRVHEWATDPVWEEIPDPVATTGEVLIEVEACAVGLTVLNCMNGNLSDDPSLLPRVPGHEVIGRVVEAGPGADTAIVGRRVAAYFYLFCGTCGECVAGHEPRCANLAGWVGVNLDGGYAPRVALPARNVVPMPEELDPVAATVVPDAVATPVHVIGRAGIGPGDRVAVFGAGGGLGIHMIQVARHAGATVAGLDIVDSKLAEVERLRAIPIRSDDLSSLDPDSIFADGPPSVVVDFIGSTDSTRWAIDGLAMGGRLVSLTTFPGRDVPVAPREFVFRELSLLGSRYANRSELAEAGRLVASGAIEPIVGHVGGPNDVLEMHNELRTQTLIGRGALDWSRA